MRPFLQLTKGRGNSGVPGLQPAGGWGVAGGKAIQKSDAGMVEQSRDHIVIYGMKFSLLSPAGLIPADPESQSLHLLRDWKSKSNLAP